MLRGLCGLSSGEGARAGGQFGSHEHLGDIYSLGRDEITSQPALASGLEGCECWAQGSGLSSYLLLPAPTRTPTPRWPYCFLEIMPDGPGLVAGLAAGQATNVQPLFPRP